MSASLSKRADLKLVGSVTSRKLIFSPGGRIACGSGLHRVSLPGVKLSHTVASVKQGLSGIDVETGDARQIGQRRHVHDRHARHLGARRGVEQLAHAGRAVLRLLHPQHDEVVILGVDVAGAGGLEAARQFARVEIDRGRAAADRHPHMRAVAVERLDLVRQANHRDLVAAEQQLDRQQRAVGGPHHQHVVGRHRIPPSRSPRPGRCRTPALSASLSRRRPKCAASPAR